MLRQTRRNDSCSPDVVHNRDQHDISERFQGVSEASRALGNFNQAEKETRIRRPHLIAGQGILAQHIGARGLIQKEICSESDSSEQTA